MQKEKKKIKIFECYRNLLYAPLYHVVAYKDKYGLNDIDISIDEEIHGDLAALNAMASEEPSPNYFPLAICDPFVNIYSENMHNSNVRLISTLIDRIAIWVVGLKYKNPSTRNQKEHNKLLVQFQKTNFETFITDIISNNKIICYPSGAYSTNSIFNHFFEVAGLPDGNRKNDFELTNAVDEKYILIQNMSHLLLTNNPWAIDDLLKTDKDFKKFQVEIIRDFGPMIVPFTGILSHKQSLEMPVKSNPLDDFVQAVGIASEKIYLETNYIIKDLIELGHDYFNIKVTGKYFEEIIENSITHNVHNRIYNSHALTSYFAWNSYGKDILSYDSSFLQKSYRTYTENYIAEKHLCKQHLLID